MLAIGIGAGLFLGWVQFPEEYNESYMCQLDAVYLEEYTLMVARGYRDTPDITLALERLRPLQTSVAPECTGSSTSIDNIPEWVQDLTERYIGQGRTNDGASCDLAALSQGFGRFTPLMEQACPELSS